VKAQTQPVTRPHPLFSYHMLVGVNIPFQRQYGYIRDERSGVESYPYPVKKDQWYINLNLDRIFVQQPPLETEIERLV